jgi:hypothetical protein
MARMTLRQAWRVWMFPVGLYWLLAIVLMRVFAEVTETIQNSGRIAIIAERIFVSVLFGGFLFILYIIMVRYERIVKVPVSQETRMYWKFFVIVYAAYFLMIIGDILTYNLPSL